jgi:hypothetical protein
MLVKLSADLTMSEAAVALQGAVQANHFGAMQVHKLKATISKKGLEFAREMMPARAVIVTINARLLTLKK